MWENKCTPSVELVTRSEYFYFLTIELVIQSVTSSVTSCNFVFQFPASNSKVKQKSLTIELVTWSISFFICNVIFYFQLLVSNSKVKKIKVWSSS